MFGRKALQCALRHHNDLAGVACRRRLAFPSRIRSFCTVDSTNPLQESLDVSATEGTPVETNEATPSAPLGMEDIIWRKIEKEEKQKDVKVRVFHDPETAVNLCLQSQPTRNFLESVDVAVNLNVDPRKADQIVRGTANLPHGNGNQIRVAVFAKGEKAQEAMDAGADLVGAEDLVDQIQKGIIDFDRTVATPDMMGIVGKVARKLGPRQLMPNPKMGTITSDIASAVKTIKAGQVQFKVEKKGILHACIGKKDFPPDKVLDNLKSFMYAVSTLKPEAIKGSYIKNVSISTTMGPSFRINVPEIDPSSSRFKA